MLGGLSVLAFKLNPKSLRLMLAFSGAFLIALSFTHIIPHLYHQHSDMEHYYGLFILGGFFLQLFLDFLSKGLEHGHAHHDDLRISPMPLLIGICLHSFLEGMPFADNFHHHDLQQTMLVGVVIHNIPISVVLMSLLLHAGFRKSTSVIFLLIFALSAPAGNLASYFIGDSMGENIEVFFSIIMALVVGIFLHISTTILFESSEHHRFNLIKLGVIILGVVLAMVS
jgi:zinc transporter ZupT